MSKTKVFIAAALALGVSSSVTAQQPAPPPLPQAPNMTLLRHRRRPRQGRRSRRHRGRRPALPDACGAPRRGRQDLARLSQHAAGRRQARGQCARPHRQRPVAELQGHGRRGQSRRTAQRQQQARLRQLALRARLHHPRRGLRAEPSRRADRLDRRKAARSRPAMIAPAATGRAAPRAPRWSAISTRRDCATTPPSKSWNSSHPSRGPEGGCSQSDLRGTGGDGLFYCFASN